MSPSGYTKKQDWKIKYLTFTGVLRKQKDKDKNTHSLPNLTDFLFSEGSNSR